MKRRFLAFVLGASTLSLGCESPVQDEIIASLGDEVEGVEEGPLHRYGQPCLACHSGYGGVGPEFAVAGTVFATPGDDIPVQGVTVTITDANGLQASFPTNCAGNFYFEAEKYAFVFPLRAEIDCPLPDGTTRRNVMGTRINRDGACAGCHDMGGPSSESPGQVFCASEQPEMPFEVISSCKGGPAAGGAP